MRVNVKGGVWTNVEDEILKVAVMKYGKNQWARISSLLVRKTPKQCKARWYEWLDPSIKKTEWSKEEEEKLLHLAKVMPTQWRTIAPLVGRTAAQCVEHYEKLLDAAQEQRDAVGSSSLPSVEEARKLRTGEIDPAPENKPARPDPVDMDEDEKEMLSEARARLANTQGKKAKRKAREKLLDEARRLASLQKRREMRAAGLPGPGFRFRGMNYNVEIPFERRPAPGFHDTTTELVRETDAQAALAKVKRPRTYTPTRDALEIAARRKDMQKEKARTEQGFLPAHLERKLQEQQAKRRAPLTLPSPQIDEATLERIVKMGYSNEAAMLLAAETETPASALLRTPLAAAMTPLTLIRGGTAVGGNATPMSVSMSGLGTPRQSPYRDPLGINAGQEPLEPSMLLDQMQRKKLREAFKSLPKPKNDFEIVIPDVE